MFALASVLVSLGAILVALSTSPTPEQPQSVELDLPKLYRTSPAATIGCLITGLANGAFWSLAPVFTAGITSNTSMAAWFMTSAVIGGALSQWPLGYASDRIGRRKILLMAAATGVVIAVLIEMRFDSLDFVGANVLGMIWGAIAFPLYAISVAHANDYAAPEDYVMVSSGLLLMYGVGAILGPFLASGIMTLTGPAGLYVFTGISHLAMVVFVAYRMLRRESSGEDHHMPFGDALATAVTASQVYEEELQQQAEDEAG